MLSYLPIKSTTFVFNLSVGVGLQATTGQFFFIDFPYSWVDKNLNKM